eukprot:GFUD01082084.1.p2 GENE.GFUD01082084.1~~GFUD01082084.1.p2  ORF type:complete len:109 (+),score=34.41 GFUD01082084.1:29-355(+)
MFLSKIMKAADHPYLKGKGGRHPNNELHHLNMAFFRHQKGLMPLFIIGFGGSIFVGLYMIRLAMKTTDVNWTKAKDERITNFYRNKQMKLINPGGHDYTNMSDDRPVY